MPAAPGEYVADKPNLESNLISLFARLGRTLGSQCGEAGVRVAEMIESQIYPIRETQIQTAQFSVFIAMVAVVEHPAGFLPATHAARGNDRHL